MCVCVCGHHVMSDRDIESRGQEENYLGVRTVSSVAQWWPHKSTKVNLKKGTIMFVCQLGSTLHTSIRAT